MHIVINPIWAFAAGVMVASIVSLFTQLMSGDDDDTGDTRERQLLSDARDLVHAAGAIIGESARPSNMPVDVWHDWTSGWYRRAGDWYKDLGDA